MEFIKLLKNQNKMFWLTFILGEISMIFLAGIPGFIGFTFGILSSMFIIHTHSK